MSGEFEARRAAASLQAVVHTGVFLKTSLGLTVVGLVVVVVVVATVVALLRVARIDRRRGQQQRQQRESGAGELGHGCDLS